MISSDWASRPSAPISTLSENLLDQCTFEGVNVFYFVSKRSTQVKMFKRRDDESGETGYAFAQATDLIGASMSVMNTLVSVANNILTAERNLPLMPG